AFQLKLSAFMTDKPTAVEHAKALRRLAPRGQSRATRIDKTVLALPTMRSNPTWSPVDALQTRHLRFAQSPALGARSATSSPSRFAGDSIARSIALVTKRLGEKKPGSIPPPVLARSGFKHIRCRQFPAKRASRIQLRQSSTN